MKTRNTVIAMVLIVVLVIVNSVLSVVLYRNMSQGKDAILSEDDIRQRIEQENIFEMDAIEDIFATYSFYKGENPTLCISFSIPQDKIKFNYLEKGRDPSMYPNAFLNRYGVPAEGIERFYFWYAFTYPDDAGMVNVYYVVH